MQHFSLKSLTFTQATEQKILELSLPSTIISSDILVKTPKSYSPSYKSTLSIFSSSLSFKSTETLISTIIDYYQLFSYPNCAIPYEL